MKHINMNDIKNDPDLMKLINDVQAARNTLKEHESIYYRIISADISEYYKPIAIVDIENGCCPGRPVIVTTNRRPDGSRNYSAQCSCGGWCTTGVRSASEALRHYERMTAGESLYWR